MKETRKQLGGRIKELRRAKGLSQSQLSERVDIDPKHLSRIEVGSGFPSLDTLEKIAEVLDVELKEFFEFTPNESRQVLLKSLQKMLRAANLNDLKLLSKVIKAILC